MQGYILIVEDTVDTCELVEELLREEGYEVRTAANGVEALAVLRAAGPARLILLDLMMPVMDGFEFLRLQRQREELASVPVVLMSGATEAALKERISAGLEFLPKPLQVEQLLRVVARYAAPSGAP